MKWFKSKTKYTELKAKKEKKEKVYTEAEAVETIGEFLRTLGYDNYEEASKQFPSLLNRVKENYRKEIKSFEKQTERQEEHLKKIPGFAYEEDRKEAKRVTNDLIAHCVLAVRWFEKQITTLDKNPTEAMKKVMNECKREETSLIESMEQVLIKKLPDSEKVLIGELTPKFLHGYFPPK